MKKLLLPLAILFGWASAVLAAPPAPLTTLRVIHSLGNEQAAKSLPVAFEATVTYFREYENTLFVQDGDVAIFVYALSGTGLVPGDRVLIKGTTQGSFRPSVLGREVTFLHHGPVPRPVAASLEDLIRAQYDCMLVKVHAIVRAADVERRSSIRNPGQPMIDTGRLQMVVEGGYAEALIESGDPAAFANLLDAEVEITGVDGGLFDGKMEQTGVLLHVASLADIKVLKHTTASPWSLPIIPADDLFSHYRVRDESQRVHVQGTVTYYQPGEAVVLQRGTKSLWISTKTSIALHINDEAEATGFADIRSGFLTLTNGEVRDMNVPASILPQPASWSELAASRRVFDLVSIEGQVVTEVRESAQDEYVLSSEGQIFTVVYGYTTTSPTPLRHIPPGTRVRVTGICILENSNPFLTQVPFNIRLRTPEDIVVVGRPSYLNVRNLVILLGILLLAVIAAGVRGWILERKIRRQTAAMARRTEAEAVLERRRSRILEDINGSRPLAEIVEQITELVSFKLHGAPCWCQIAGGARLGNDPPNADALRIVRENIPARSGSSLGVLAAALDPLCPPTAIEQDALSMGARLAMLAIETRRLYSDLRHRSEFDLLTDAHNRFSLDKQLDAFIEEARSSAGIFGLIYIDLDDFKRVNDLYGHQAGDLYLQEVTSRMKRQLRSRDMLARLGGDEFAVLVAVVRDRAAANEIAQRLEHCFDAPIEAEGFVLHGSASVGVALYPEDGATRDSLLIAADAAMYVAKKTRNRTPEPSESPRML